MDMRIRRDQGLLDALVVKAETAFDAGKTPALGRHRDPLVVRIAAARQSRLARSSETVGWLRVEAWPLSGNVVSPGRSAMYSTRTSPVTAGTVGRSSIIRPFPQQVALQASHTTA